MHRNVIKCNNYIYIDFFFYGKLKLFRSADMYLRYQQYWYSLEKRVFVLCQVSYCFQDAWSLLIMNLFPACIVPFLLHVSVEFFFHLKFPL